MKSNTWPALVLPGFSFFLALLSKETAITFLAVIPLALYFFTKAPLRKIVQIFAVLTAIVAVFLLIRHQVLGALANTQINVADNFLVAAENPQSKMATAVYILGLYLKLLVIPYPLVSDYSYNQIPIIGPLDLRFLAAFAVYLGAAIFAFRKIKARDRVAFGILFYLATLSIVSNIFITIGTSMGERLLYIPSLGFCLVVVVLVGRAFTVDPENYPPTFNAMLRTNFKPVAIFVPVLLLFAVQTVVRSADWKDNYSLFSRDVLVSPRSARTHGYLGTELMKERYLKGMPESMRNDTIRRGIAELERSVQVLPAYAEAWSEMGLGHYKVHDYAKAESNYKRSIEIDPKSASTHLNYGGLLFQTGRYDEAVKEYLESLKYNTGDPETLCNLGSAYAMLHRFAEAQASFLKAIQSDPNYARAYQQLGFTYRDQGDSVNASLNFNRAAQLDPTLGK